MRSSIYGFRRLIGRFALHEPRSPARGGRGSRRAAWNHLVIAPVFLTAVGATHAGAQVAGEYEVKAAFLYNFAKFIEWPAHTFHTVSDAFAICILGDDPFGGMLDSAVSGKSVQDRPFAVRHLNEAEEATQCQMLFLGASETNQVRRIQAGLRGASVLIVGDVEDVVHSGGMIAFHMEGNRVRFMINQGAVEQAGLQISSQLLKVADKVITTDSRP